MKSKAQLEAFKTLEKNFVDLRDHVQTFPRVYADLRENDSAHNLLQRNLKNLYDLFMAMKGEPSAKEDPMFTTKAITQCASCTKGVR